MTLRALAGHIGSRLSSACPGQVGATKAVAAGIAQSARQLRNKGYQGFGETNNSVALRNQAGRCCAHRTYSSATVMASSASMAEQIKEKNEKYPVMVYSKSYCPFCGQVKGLFKKLQVDFQSVNLDEIYEGQEVQDGLAGITGVSTVPQVFINGKFIGGCDDTMKLHSNGELKKMLEEAGIPSAF